MPEIHFNRQGAQVASFPIALSDTPTLLYASIDTQAPFTPFDLVKHLAMLLGAAPDTLSEWLKDHPTVGQSALNRC